MLQSSLRSKCKAGNPDEGRAIGNFSFFVAYWETEKPRYLPLGITNLHGYRIDQECGEDHRMSQQQSLRDISTIVSVREEGVGFYLCHQLTSGWDQF